MRGSGSSKPLDQIGSIVPPGQQQITNIINNNNINNFIINDPKAVAGLMQNANVVNGGRAQASRENSAVPNQ